MFLSNRLPIVIIFIALTLLSACSWFSSGEVSSPAVALPTPKIETPFSVREPREFSAEFFTIADGLETRRIYARKGDAWKLVIYKADDPMSETIQNGKQILVDHKRKVFAEASERIGFDPDFIQEMTIRALRERKYTSFEDLGLTENIRKYRATVRDVATSSAVMFYDEDLKMITRQEFFTTGTEPEMVFELRNISLEVADEVFLVPDKYRKVSEKEFYASPK